MCPAPRCAIRRVQALDPASPRSHTPVPMYCPPSWVGLWCCAGRDLANSQCTRASYRPCRCSHHPPLYLAANNIFRQGKMCSGITDGDGNALGGGTQPYAIRAVSAPSKCSVKQARRILSPAYCVRAPLPSLANNYYVRTVLAPWNHLHERIPKVPHSTEQTPPLSNCLMPSHYVLASAGMLPLPAIHEMRNPARGGRQFAAGMDDGL